MKKVFCNFYIATFYSQKINKCEFKHQTDKFCHMKSDKILTRNQTYGIWQSLNHDLFKNTFLATTSHGWVTMLYSRKRKLYWVNNNLTKKGKKIMHKENKLSLRLKKLHFCKLSQMVRSKVFSLTISFVLPSRSWRSTLKEKRT